MADGCTSMKKTLWLLCSASESASRLVQELRLKGSKQTFSQLALPSAEAVRFVENGGVGAVTGSFNAGPDVPSEQTGNHKITEQ